MIPRDLLARDSQLRYCMAVLGPLRLSRSGGELTLDCQPISRPALMLVAHDVHEKIADLRAADPERRKIPWAADAVPRM